MPDSAARPSFDAVHALPAHLEHFVERLAEANHDTWAAGRFTDGWRFGEDRDETAKPNPLPVPYSTLPESEKEIDRRAVRALLGSLYALGYELTPTAPLPEDSAPDDVASRNEAILAFIESDDVDVAKLVALWQDHDGRDWSRGTHLYENLARRFIKEAEYLLAYEVVAEGLSYAPEDLFLLHLKGLALARSGAFATAHEVALVLYGQVRDTAAGADSVVVEEAVSFLGRSHKDLAAATADANIRAHHLRASHAAYVEAFERSRGYFPAINAASMAYLLGEAELADRYAGRAFELAEAATTAKRSGHYWALATLGEAELIRGRVNEAARYYAEAVAAAGNDVGSIVSMRRQVLLLTSDSELRPEWVEKVLQVPRVAIFGPRSNEPTTPDPAALAEELERLGVGFGYGIPATAREMEFLEAVEALGGETYVVVPYPAEVYGQMAFGGDAALLERYQRTLAEAREVIPASETTMQDAALLMRYARLICEGLAMMKCQALQSELVRVGAAAAVSASG